MVEKFLHGNLHLPLLAHHLDLLQSVQFQSRLMQYARNGSFAAYPTPTFDVVTGFFQLTLANYSFA